MEPSVGKPPQTSNCFKPPTILKCKTESRANPQTAGRPPGHAEAVDRAEAGGDQQEHHAVGDGQPPKDEVRPWG